MDFRNNEWKELLEIDTLTADKNKIFACKIYDYDVSDRDIGKKTLDWIDMKISKKNKEEEDKLKEEQDE